MAVPASFNDIAADAAVRDYFGDVWYQRTVWVPQGWQGQRDRAALESATHRATVWVNETEVMSHEGGCTPFEADITDHVSAGEQIRIAPLINNILHWQAIPPGVIETLPQGKASVTGTTSSTTQAFTAVSGFTPPTPATSATSRSLPILMAATV
jgi:beta-glucuronidase